MDPIVRQCLIVGGAGLVAGVAYAVDAWWGTPARRRARAHKWAREQVASYEDQWLVAFQEQGVVTRRASVVACFLSLVILLEIPMGGQPFAAWLFGLPAAYAIFRALTCTRMSLPPGTRVARLRELELVDYIPQRTRLFMWFAGTVGCLACVLVALVRHEWLIGVSGLLMVLAPACVELAGGRLARLPEPAQNPAHLYLQDVMRADHIRAAAVSTALGAAMLCNWLSVAVDDTGWLEGILMVTNVVLLTGVYVVTLKPGLKASTYMRSRLWPQLRPGELVTDAEPVRAAVAM
jgi:hypothetical protein